MKWGELAAEKAFSAGSASALAGNVSTADATCSFTVW